MNTKTLLSLACINKILVPNIMKLPKSLFFQLKEHYYHIIYMGENYMGTDRRKKVYLNRSELIIEVQSFLSKSFIRLKNEQRNVTRLLLCLIRKQNKWLVLIYPKLKSVEKIFIHRALYMYIRITRMYTDCMCVCVYI